MITFLIALAAFCLGVNVTIYILDRKVITPMRQMLSASQKGWQQSIDLIREITGIQQDGSVKSPIQVHKHE